MTFFFLLFFRQEKPLFSANQNQIVPAPRKALLTALRSRRNLDYPDTGC